MTGAMKFKIGIKYRKEVRNPRAQRDLECSKIKTLISSLLDISTITSQLKSRELNQDKSKNGTIILPPGIISHRGDVPIHIKKYFADKEREAVVPVKNELDFFTSEGKSVFLISSTNNGTKNIDVSKR